MGEKAEKYSRTAPQDIWIYYRDIRMLNDVNADFDIIPIHEFYDNDLEIVCAEELSQQFRA